MRIQTILYQFYQEIQGSLVKLLFKQESIDFPLNLQGSTRICSLPRKDAIDFVVNLQGSPKDHGRGHDAGPEDCAVGTLRLAGLLRIQP